MIVKGNVITEYEPKELENNLEKVYFKIPYSIVFKEREEDIKISISKPDEDLMRIAVFSYLQTFKGLNNQCVFSIKSMLKWMNIKPCRTNQNGSNYRLLNIIKYFKNIGYIDYSSDEFESGIGISWKEAKLVTVNTNKINDDCTKQAFITCYYDEVKKILDLNQQEIKLVLDYDKKHSNINNLKLLYLFMYCRYNIIMRKNTVTFTKYGTMSYEEEMRMKIKQYPEAYNCYYKDIAYDIGLKIQDIDEGFKLLEYLKLIHCERLKNIRVDNDDGEYIFKKNYAVITNYYKREKGMLLAYGSDYFSKEIRNKTKIINDLLYIQG